MVINQKRKGSGFERDLVKLLNDKIHRSSWKRVPSSGAIGTNMNEPFLTGDVNGTVESIPKRFKIEAKVGYGGAKQLTLKKEWLEKIIEESGMINAIPMVVGKFSGSRSRVSEFVVLDFETFAYLINYITELKGDNNG